jgi:hypothetical protein
MNDQIFGREHRPRPCVLSKLCYAALGIVLPVSGLMAHEPGEGLRQKQSATLRALSPAPQTAASTVTDGLWTTLPYLMPINPIHCSLLRTGKVLIISGSENNPPEHEAGEYYAAVWDPQSGAFAVQNLLWDLFCNGMAALPDGRFLVVGGSAAVAPPYGEFRATVFDPATEKFTQVESMAHGRWYATVTELSDGGLMAFSGLTEEGYTGQPGEDTRGVHNQNVEIYHVGAGWSPEYEAPWVPPLYPHLHLLPNGNVFYSGETISSNIFNPFNQTWTLNVAHTIYPNGRIGGSSVLLPLRPESGYVPKVMILGGDHTATATTEVIDLSAATPAWRMLAPMSLPRTRMNAVLLPTGKVLALGGSSIDEDPNTASLAADLFDPVTESWASAGVATYPRLYHSCGLLLPDATVWVVGSNPKKGTYDNNIEVYSPAYLYTVDGNGNVIPAVRPTITAVPAEIGYGGSFAITTPDSSTIASAVLVRPGSPSHGFDFEQRLVGLSFTSNGGTLTATSPPNGSIAPPGYYMLFLINQAGVPSLAKFVHLSGAPTDLPPKGNITSPTGDLTISPGQSVNFAGSATDPDGTVSSYSWIFPDGIPEASSLPSPGLVSFTEVGTHVVSLTTIDAFGVNDPSPPTRTITVQLATLQLTFTAPPNGAVVSGRKVSVSLSASGTSGTSNTFTLSVDGTVIGAKTGGHTVASFTWKTVGYAKGLHTLSATVKDSTGNTGSASESVTLQ